MVVLAGTETEFLAWQAKTGKPGAKRAKPVWSTAQLPERECELVLTGHWFQNPVAQDPEFWKWRNRWGDLRGRGSELRNFMDRIMELFPGTIVGKPGK